jgi:hypothetical protein
VIDFRDIFGSNSPSMADRFFRNKNVDDIVQNIKDKGVYTVDIPKVEVPNAEPKNAHFKVGINQDGQTQLTVGDSYTTTLTLNDTGVLQLIKLLAVTIDENYTVTVTEND